MIQPYITCKPTFFSGRINIPEQTAIYWCYYYYFEMKMENGGGMAVVLLLGQVVSLAVAVMAFTSSLLSNLGVFMPLTLSLFGYLSVTLIYGGLFLGRRQKLMCIGINVQAEILSVPCHYNRRIVAEVWSHKISKALYFLFSVIGIIVSNILYDGIYNSRRCPGIVNTAYQYTSITSVTILDCWTIAWTMILTWIFIGTRYSIRQFLGATVCLMGLGLVVCSDAGIGGGGGTRPLLGDALVILGTLCFAMSIVSEEYCVKNKDRVEVMAMSSAFSLIITICQIVLVERKNVESVTWSAKIILCFAGYALASFTLISIIPFVLKMSGSTMYSLSVLTSDMWAVIIRIFFYHQQVGGLYYLSFTIVVIGLIIYSKTVKEVVPEQPRKDEDLDGQYKLLDEENVA